MHLHPDQFFIDDRLVRDLVTQQFPEWSDLPLVAIRTGSTENAIYRLGDQLAVRLPLQPGKDAQVAKLATWLPRLAPKLSLPVPEPVAVGVPSHRYPSPWLVVRWLEGEEATLDALSDPVEAAADLASFVRTLMSQDAAGAPAPGHHNFSRGVPLEERDEVTRRSIAALGNTVDADAITRVWKRALASPAWDGDPVWVHGDLSSSNLLASEGRLSAVIDWGGLAAGDPATELLPAWNLFRGESRAAYREGVGLDDATWARGRGLALSIALVALAYYQDTNPYMVNWAEGMVRETLRDDVC